MPVRRRAFLGGEILKEFQSYNRLLLSLAVSILVERFLSAFMGSVNIFLLSGYSDNAVAAVGVANQYINTGQMLVALAANGGSVVISQNLGARLRRQADTASMGALFLALTIGAAVSALCIAAPGLLLAPMGLEPVLHADAATYLRFVGGALVLYGLFTTMSAVCRCYEHPQIPMYTIILMNVLNALGTYVVVYRPFEIPLYGVSGVAFMYVASMAVSVLVLAFLTRHVMKDALRLSCLRPLPRKLLGDIVHMGLPQSVEQLSYNVSQIVTTGFIVVLGVTTISAKTYLSNIIIYIYISGMSVGYAAQIIISHMLGAGQQDRAYRFAHRNLIFTLGLNLFFITMVLVFKQPLFSLFTTNQEIIDLAAKVLIVEFLIEIGRSFSQTYTIAVRGAGDVKFTMVVMLLSTWIVCVPLAYLFSNVFGWGLVGIWVAFCIDEWTRAMFSLYRWNSGKWRGKVVVQAPETPKEEPLPAEAGREKARL